MTDTPHHLGHTEPPNFPSLDAPRATANTEYNRDIIDILGHIEPYVGEVDYWCSMPIRLTHNQAAGFILEVGPYDLDRADIDALRAAIVAYDAATGRTK
ncbi:hypothetical protein BHQ15_17800 [Mycolicibacillus koreensis]|nr:hypothetical protein BHQ15_17800 [Mycolicibacillus koreensis]